MKTFGVIILSAGLAIGCGNSDSNAQKATSPIDHTYSAYGKLLGQYVSEDRVNYSDLIKNRAGLDSLVEALGAASLDGTSSDQKMAFYINAYNILTLRSIIDEYPVASIKDIKGVWDKKKWVVSGKKITLNDIEHNILRKEFSEPRIHISIVCASIGCPPLMQKPYLPEFLEQQLTESARNFAVSEKYNRLDPETGEALLSSIFDWFGDDFIEKYYNKSKFSYLSEKENAALNFIIGQLPDEEQLRLEKIEFRIKYLDYDWSLNDRK